MSERYFVTGIGTEIGKTVVSSVLCEALQADYWKPIQAGNLDYTDADSVRDWISNDKSHIHPISCELQTPMSPHAAADIDGVKIDPTQLKVPETANTLVIEGAGGLMVPLNDKDLIIDLIYQFRAQAIVVIRHYLGSINHSMMTLEMLAQRNIPVKGIIFNGTPVPTSEEIILKHWDVPVLGRVAESKSIDRDFVRDAAAGLNL